MDETLNLKDEFDLQTQILETAGSKAWRVFYQAQNRAATLWISNLAFSTNSSAYKHINDRFNQLKRYRESGIAKIISHGFEKSGRAYYLSDPFDMEGALTIANKEASSQREAERRIVGILKIVAALHKANFTFGDLSQHSFLLQRNGDVQLVGFMGFYGLNETDKLSQQSVFLAPELYKLVPDVKKESDIFSLGVLCYWLYTGEYPYKFSENPDVIYEENYTPIEKYLNQFPAWLPEFLTNSLQHSADKRFRDAEQMLKFIYDFRNKDYMNKNALVLSYQNTKKQGEVPIVRNQEIKKHITFTGVISKAPKIYRWYALLVLVIFGLVIYESTREEISPFFQVASDKVSTIADLKELTTVLETRDFEKFTSSINQLKKSEDSLLYYFLTELTKFTFKDLSTYAAQASEIKGLLDYKLSSQKSESLQKVFEFYYQQLNVNSSEKIEVPTWYKNLINLLNPILPGNKKHELLREIFSENKGLYFDFQLAEKFDGRAGLKQGFINELVVYLKEKNSELVNLNLNSMSLLGMLLLDRHLIAIFEEQITKQLNQLTKYDMQIVLPSLAKRQEAFFEICLNIAKKNNLIEATANIFLLVIKENPSLTAEQRNSILKAAFGSFSKEDLAVVAEWLHSDAAKVFAGLLADDRYKNFNLDIFDIIAAKTYSIEILEQFVSWVRKYAWDSRSMMGALLGKAIYSDYFTVEDFVKDLKLVDPLYKNQDFIKFALTCASPKLALAVLELYPEEIDLGQKIMLLRHPEKAVRLKTIEMIETNDLAALKIIKDTHQNEKDVDVLNAYKKFWIFE